MQGAVEIYIGNNVSVGVDITGSGSSKHMVKAVTQKILGWFDSQKRHNKNTFYKFKARCNHYLYKENDSWVEELGCGHKAFNRAIDVVGVRYKSKTAFENAEDKFQGKLFACYHDRQKRITVYLKNLAFFDDPINMIRSSNIFQAVKKPLKNLCTKNIQTAMPRQTKSSRDLAIDNSHDRSRNGHRDHSSIYRNNKTLQNPQPPTAAKAAAGGEELLNLIIIWNEYLGDKENVEQLRPRKKKQLLRIFRETCKSNLDIWKNLCRMLAANKYLNGQISTIGWKITLDWLLKPRNWDKINQEKYGLKLGSIYHLERTVEQGVEEIIHKQQSRGVSNKMLELYSKLLEKLSQLADPDAIVSWFGDTMLLVKDSKHWVIKASSDFIADSIKTRFDQELRQIQQSFGLDEVTVEAE